MNCPTNHLKPNENALIVTKILEILLQLRIETKEEHDILDYLRIDIQILEEKNEYSVQISYCGKWEEEYYHKILTVMGQFCDKVILKDENNFYCKNLNCHGNEDNLQSRDEMISIRKEFYHFKEFLSIKLKPKLSSNNLEEFESLVLEKIHALRDLHSNVKFKFSRDSKILHNNELEFDKDYKSCCLVSSALLNIVKQSQREEYRKKCFDLFGVKNSEDLDYSITTYLLSQIYSNIDKTATKKLS